MTLGENNFTKIVSLAPEVLQMDFPLIRLVASLRSRGGDST
jgi:hypothetical protein